MTEKIKLHTNQDREHFDQLADLYSLIIATEHLERAYIKATITAKEYNQITRYTPMCLQLIAQYKTATSLLGGVDVRQFMRQYNVR